MDTSPQILALGRCGVGFAKEPLPVLDGCSLLGHSWVGKVGRPGQDTLWARALHLAPLAGGEGVTLVFVDLWSCSARLWLASLAAAGARPDSLVLFGTHTHTGPSRFLGASFYEVFGAKLQPGRMGYDPVWTRKLADAIGSAARQAREQAAGPGQERMLAVVRKPVWGASRNRSQAAFCETPEYQTGAWWQQGAPGESCPQGLAGGDVARSIDPRLDALVALDAAGEALAVCGFFGSHATALGPKHELFDRDWPGVAVDYAHSEGKGLFAAIGISAAGDVTPLRPGDDEAEDQGPDLRDEVGQKLGAGLLEVARAAARRGRELVADSVTTPIPPLEVTAMAGLWQPVGVWEMGLPAMAGAEDGRSHLPFVTEGRRHRVVDPGDEQSPKILILGHLQELVRNLFELELEAAHPWHRLRLGDHLIQTVPGEPTGVAAYRLGLKLRTLTGARSATVAGYSGDYIGYFTTPEEYCSQQYEGGSTLYGRGSLELLAGHLEAWAPRELARDLAALAATLPAEDRALALEAADEAGVAAGDPTKAAAALAALGPEDEARFEDRLRRLSEAHRTPEE